MSTDTDCHADVVPDISKARRFSLGVGLILAIYVFAGGELSSDVHGSLVNIKISRPGILLLFGILVSVYSTYRFWYFGVKVPITGTKIRSYLKQPQSLLIVKFHERAYRESLGRQVTNVMLAHVPLEERCLPGLTPFNFIVFTDSMSDPTEGYMRRLAANRVDRYFPGINPGEITLLDSPGDDAHMKWATVGNLSRGTQWRELLEDFDLFAPILLNTFSIVLLAGSISYCLIFYCP